MPRDPLRRWWQHSVAIERLRGEGAYGPAFESIEIPDTPNAAIDDKTQLVRNSKGEEVISSTTVALHKSTRYIPPGSRLTLPESHGGRTAFVIATKVAAAGLPVDHLQLNLE